MGPHTPTTKQNKCPDVFSEGMGALMMAGDSIHPHLPILSIPGFTLSSPYKEVLDVLPYGLLLRGSCCRFTSTSSRGLFAGCWLRIICICWVACCSTCCVADCLHASRMRMVPELPRLLQQGCLLRAVGVWLLCAHVLQSSV